MGCPDCPKKQNHQSYCDHDTKSTVFIEGNTEIIMFRKVVIPASMGDETDVPVEVGKYRNVILEYEANKNVYIYSSDGVPSRLSAEVEKDFNNLANRPKYAGVVMSSDTDIPSVSDTKAEIEEELNDTKASLETAIASEASAREAADTSLSTALAEETGNRTAADTALGERIDTLAGTQSADIAALEAEIATKQKALTAGYGIGLDNQGNISVTLDEVPYVLVNALPNTPASGNENKIHLVPLEDDASKYYPYLYITELSEWKPITTFYPSIDLADYATTSYVDTQIATTSGDVTQIVTSLTTMINDETLARQGADNTLQTQIDTVVAASDVKDIVGTKAALNSYDTSTLGNNDIIKVLKDESQNDATTYYRWSTSTSTFTLIGSEGPYYTKSEVNGLITLQTTDPGTGATLAANHFIGVY